MALIILKVKNDSDPNKVAIAIRKSILESKEAVLEAMGPLANYKCLQAFTIARNLLEAHDLVHISSFEDRIINGQEMTLMVHKVVCSSERLDLAIKLKLIKSLL